MPATTNPVPFSVFALWFFTINKQHAWENLHHHNKYRRETAQSRILETHSPTPPWELNLTQPQPRDPGLTRHRRNTYLTSLPLVSVRRHGRVTQWKSRYSLRVQAPFSWRQMHLTNASESIKAKYFLAKFWRLTSVNTSYQNCLEFVILCSYRWLEIEVTARHKKKPRISAVSLNPGEGRRVPRNPYWSGIPRRKRRAIYSLKLGVRELTNTNYFLKRNPTTHS